ncbi:helix-turn-helix domain-containing protein [Paenibacillus senegalensis]|uniref:helix-turn-helix domain-containing protein n=1 Tax=Paenibacillus senegalensis TaxID=1465766 RepID=UPI000289A23F|nr:AraC family transcriptional regulator [Paenibacillus senegalensis]
MHLDEQSSLTCLNPTSRTDLKQIREYMEHHYHEPLSIAQLAQMANLSPKYFVYLFKKTFGHSAIDYLTDLRINRAKRYLLESDYRMREIAHKVGYSDEFYFSRKFKKEVGISPSEYVKKRKIRVAACSPPVMGQLLALQIVPVSAPLNPKWTPYYYYTYRSKIEIGLEFDGLHEANWRDWVRSRPDRIVGDEHLPAKVRQKLEDMAPSIFLPVHTMNWREQLRKIALFLGREEQGRVWIDSYEQKIQFARKQLAPVLGADSFAVLRLYGEALYLYCNQGMYDLLFHDLELTPAYAAEVLYNTEISLEQLARLDPDRILIAVCPESASRAYWLSLRHNKLWGKLKAVKHGRVYSIHSDPWFEYSATAIDRMLDELLLFFMNYNPNQQKEKMHGGSIAHPI